MPFGGSNTRGRRFRQFGSMPDAFPSFTIESNTKVLLKIQFLSTHLSKCRKEFRRTRAAQFTYLYVT